MTPRASSNRASGRGAMVLLLLVALLLVPPTGSVAGPSTAIPQSAETYTDPARSIGTANPAAVYCLELGYGYEIVEAERGERGLCVLPDGRKVSAWEFFRGKVGAEYSYCARLGYDVITKDLGDGSYVAECAVCVDADGNEVGTVAELMGLDERTMHGFTVPSDLPDLPWPDPVTRDLPSYYSWCDLGGCSSVKDQALSGKAVSGVSGPSSSWTGGSSYGISTEGRSAPGGRAQRQTDSGGSAAHPAAARHTSGRIRTRESKVPPTDIR